MMTVKRLSAFPYELSFVGERLSGREKDIEYVFKSSRAAWLVCLDEVPLCVFGVWRLSLIGSATRLWFVACEDFPKMGRKIARKLLRNIKRLLCVTGPLSITVDTGNSRNVRFAEFLGFERSGQIIHEDCKAYSYFFLR